MKNEQIRMGVYIVKLFNRINLGNIRTCMTYMLCGV